MKAFQTQTGNLVITNYRVLFVPANQKEKYFDQLMQHQPPFVHEFFNVPIGLICRIDR